MAQDPQNSAQPLAFVEQQWFYFTHVVALDRPVLPNDAGSPEPCVCWEHSLHPGRRQETRAKCSFMIFQGRWEEQQGRPDFLAFQFSLTFYVILCHRLSPLVSGAHGIPVFAV